MPKFKVVLTVITEMKNPLGPRLRRATPMPMEKLYEDRGGYFFDPETEMELAHECAKAFEKYLEPPKKRGK
jgi:hypothetical protein